MAPGKCIPSMPRATGAPLGPTLWLPQPFPPVLKGGAGGGPSAPVLGQEMKAAGRVQPWREVEGRRQRRGPRSRNLAGSFGDAETPLDENDHPFCASFSTAPPQVLPRPPRMMGADPSPASQDSWSQPPSRCGRVSWRWSHTARGLAAGTRLPPGCQLPDLCSEVTGSAGSSLQRFPGTGGHRG